MWLDTEATATAGVIPMKISSGVIRKPPPMPNMPDTNPTAAPVTFTFTTPTVRLLSTSWYRRGDAVSGAMVFLLRFNQPVEPYQVSKHLSLRYEPHPWTEPTLPQESLARMAALDPDVIVAEAGASPLEPYNGTEAYRRLAPLVKLTILCASDPYAVLGVQHAFNIAPDFVAGPAANTTAAIELVKRLTGVRALNLLERGGAEELRMLLDERIVRPCLG